MGWLALAANNNIELVQRLCANHQSRFQRQLFDNVHGAIMPIAGRAVHGIYHDVGINHRG
jgi:hypothetical protein